MHSFGEDFVAQKITPPSTLEKVVSLSAWVLIVLNYLSVSLLSPQTVLVLIISSHQSQQILFAR